MAIDVVMPQMGESIAEGTVTRWMKKQGDRVERDEPLFEISTDKVDAEIPAPAAGTLVEILAPEGKTVPVNSVVARLQAEGEATAAAPQRSEPQKTEAPKPQPAQPAAAAPPAEPRPAPNAEQRAAQESAADELEQEAPAAAPQPSRPQAAPLLRPQPAPPPSGQRSAPAEPRQSEKVTSLDERRRTRSSPLVRKIARENDVDISQIEGTGVSGRVTKQDILQYLESPQPQRAGSAEPAPAMRVGLTDRIEPMSMMRKRIAEHMVMSRRTSAHVTTVFEVDFTEVDKLRRKHKRIYADRGSTLTYLPFIVQAVIEGIREFPILNASIDAENVIYHSEINVGIAVALDWGLIVPVLKHADEKNIFGMAKAINDLGERARTKKLNPDDVQGGTFTITNPGVYGGLFGTPIINQPQVAILGVGGVKKRAVVIDTDEGDAIVIRSMCYLALSFDHRLIDGAVADQFMAKVKAVIEDGEFAM
jgi:pyruvate dehydrogenase E2 component (dihydrolipoamide acetyltransferase)